MKVFLVTELRNKLKAAKALRDGAKTPHERDAAERAVGSGFDVVQHAPGEPEREDDLPRQVVLRPIR